MLLKTSDSSFEMTILGYQYPDAAGETYDANWLLIQVDAASPEGAWSASDPCLLTYEAEKLARWLQALAQPPGEGQPPPAPALSFLEPVLLFRVVEPAGTPQALRVHFGALLHPSWAEKTSGSTDRWLDFPLSDREMLLSASRDLQQELKRYPSRAEY